MRPIRDGWFAVLLIWTAVAGSLLGNGMAHGIIPLVVIGAVMSAACPWGVIAAWVWQQWRP